MVSDQILALRVCIKELSQRQNVVKQVLGGKKSAVHVDRHTGRVREQHTSLTLRESESESKSHPHGNFNQLFRKFLWPIILICLVLSLYLEYLRVIPCVHVHLSTKVYSREEVQGYLIITPLLTSTVLSSWEGLLDFKNEEYVVSYLLSGQAQPPLSIVLLLGEAH